MDLQYHHVFGRPGSGACLGFPWSELPELGSALCWEQCHGPLTDGKLPDLDERLKRAALARLGERLDIVPLDLDSWGADLVGIAREMVRVAESMGLREKVMEGRA